MRLAPTTKVARFRTDHHWWPRGRHDGNACSDRPGRSTGGRCAAERCPSEDVLGSSLSSGDRTLRDRDPRVRCQPGGRQHLDTGDVLHVQLRFRLQWMGIGDGTGRYLGGDLHAVGRRWRWRALQYLSRWAGGPGGEGRRDSLGECWGGAVGPAGLWRNRWFERRRRRRCGIREGRERLQWDGRDSFEWCRCRSDRVSCCHCRRRRRGQCPLPRHFHVQLCGRHRRGHRRRRWRRR